MRYNPISSSRSCDTIPLSSNKYPNYQE